MMTTWIPERSIQDLDLESLRDYAYTLKAELAILAEQQAEEIEREEPVPIKRHWHIRAGHRGSRCRTLTTAERWLFRFTALLLVTLTTLATIQSSLSNGNVYWALVFFLGFISLVCVMIAAFSETKLHRLGDSVCDEQLDN